MALVQCPECGKSVSDQAETCPECGRPLKAKASPDIETRKPAKTGNRYRTGSIVGLIGGVGMILVTVVVIFGLQHQDSSQTTVSINVAGLLAEESGAVMQTIGFVCVFAATIAFIAGLIVSNKSASARKAVAVAALILSVVGLVGLLIYYNLLALCFMFLFLWEPILEVVGSIMMVTSAVKDNA